MWSRATSGRPRRSRGGWCARRRPSICRTSRSRTRRRASRRASDSRRWKMGERSASRKRRERPSMAEAASNGAGKGARYEPRLQKHYREVVAPQLKEEFGYANDLTVPRLDKIVLNMGIGEAVADSKKVQSAAEDLALIAGQKPVITKARSSIATFKLREGMPVGAKVTLRKAQMFEFLDRVVTIALPRVRDFRGLNPNSFDGRGNYALGIKEQIIFPEINYDQIEKVRGMDVIITTTAGTDEEARELLRLFNFPFPAVEEQKQAA